MTSPPERAAGPRPTAAAITANGADGGIGVAARRDAMKNAIDFYGPQGYASSMESGISTVGAKISYLVFGGDYDANAAAAAEAIAQEKGKVYLHSYLGVHRIAVVKRLLAGKGQTSGEHLLHRGERGEYARALDRAQAEYEAGRYAAAAELLSRQTSLDGAGRLLKAWSEYHLGRYEAARKDFAAASSQGADAVAVEIGIAYCALQSGDLKSAEHEFSEALEAAPKSAAALIGRGLTRLRAKNDAAARRDFKEALAVEPGNSEALNGLKQVEGRARAMRKAAGPRPQPFDSRFSQ